MSNSSESPWPQNTGEIGDWLQFLAVRTMIGATRLLPYRGRLAAMGWLTSRVVAPLAGYDKRVRDNLDLILPDLDADTRAEIIRKVPDNVGRTMAELFAPEKLARIAHETPFEGPGLEILEKHRREGRPIIVVSGHFGNYDVIRAGLIARGFDVGGLYREMSNRFFNAYYVRMISQTGTPLFPAGRDGLAQMIKHLRKGGTLAVLIDLHMASGKPLTFFGHKAYTATSTAEMALKYGALIVPCYAIRQPDGVSFRAVFEKPVAPSSPEKMTQDLNDSLEARVRADPGQWFWIHRRWKDTSTPQREEGSTS